MDLSILDISYQGKHRICGLLSLATFTCIMFSGFIHVVAWVSTSFFLWLNILHCMDIPYVVVHYGQLGCL
jgi:hypothetical protein